MSAVSFDGKLNPIPQCRWDISMVRRRNCWPPFESAHIRIGVTNCLEIFRSTGREESTRHLGDGGHTHLPKLDALFVETEGFNGKTGL